MSSLLKRVLGVGAREGRAPVAVTVYSRAGCGCCVKAIAVLEEAGSRHRLVVDVVDVDGDPELKDRYGAEVPVVMVARRVRFRGVVNPAMLDRLLRAEAAEHGV